MPPSVIAIVLPAVLLVVLPSGRAVELIMAELGFALSAMSRAFCSPGEMGHSGYPPSVLMAWRPRVIAAI